MKLGFGGAVLGNLYRAVDDRTARLALEAAWAGGIRTFDTAPYYGLGRSEKRLAPFLAEVPRDEVVISTKVGRLLEADPSLEGCAERHGFVDPLPFRVRFDYTYDGVMWSWEESCRRLGVDRIDILLVHDIGTMTHGAAAARHFADLASSGYEALAELRGAGAVGEIGLGVNEWQVCEQAMAMGEWDTFLLAGRYTLLEQESARSFLPKCAAHGAKVIIGGAFNSGILATGVRCGGAVRYNYEHARIEVIERVARIEDICRSYDVPLAAAALQFPAGHPTVDCVLAGLGSPAEVEAALRLVAEPIPSALWHDLACAGLIEAQVPIPGATV